MGADETIFEVKGREVVVGFVVVDGQSGRTLGFEVLFEGDGEAFKEWLKPYAEELGAEVLVTDDNDSYGLAADGPRLSHQLCVAHVRKYVKRRSKSIPEQAEREWGEEEEAPEKESAKLEADLGRVRELVEEPPGEGGGNADGPATSGLLVGVAPRAEGREGLGGLPDEDAHPGAVEQMAQVAFVPEEAGALGMDGTNNASERSIGRSEVRYKTMRGYKSTDGMNNGIGLTQWLYSGQDEHDLAKEMAA